MAKKDVVEFVWKDRKRILGMPITFTKYWISENRFFNSKGLFNTQEQELLMYRILDLKLDRSFGEKILGVGTITLYTADKSNPEIKLEHIKHPRNVRDLISKIVEAERLKINIRGKEMFGVADQNSVDMSMHISDSGNQ
jgi:uncharacterized membrane protein YdbT with pleckstrin-like domain